MADQKDLRQPSLSSLYSTEVLDTLRGHILRLWTLDYRGMAGIERGMKRIEKGANGSLRIYQWDGSKDVLLIDSDKFTSHSTGGVTLAKMTQELSKRALRVHTHTIQDVDGLENKLRQKSDVGHIHSISDITGLQATLNRLHQAATGSVESGQKTVSYEQIPGLRAALNAKAGVNHTHNIGQIAGLSESLKSINKALAKNTNSISSLEGGGAGGGFSPFGGGTINSVRGLRAELDSKVDKTVFSAKTRSIESAIARISAGGGGGSGGGSGGGRDSDNTVTVGNMSSAGSGIYYESYCRLIKDSTSVSITYTGLFKITLIGGGGGAYYERGSNAKCSGGGGEVVEIWAHIDSGTSLRFTIGSGGGVRTSGKSASDGGNTLVSGGGLYYTADGGQGGGNIYSGKKGNGGGATGGSPKIEGTGTPGRKSVSLDSVSVIRYGGGSGGGNVQGNTSSSQGGLNALNAAGGWLTESRTISYPGGASFSYPDDPGGYGAGGSYSLLGGSSGQNGVAIIAAIAY